MQKNKSLLFVVLVLALVTGLVTVYLRNYRGSNYGSSVEVGGEGFLGQMMPGRVKMTVESDGAMRGEAQPMEIAKDMVGVGYGPTMPYPYPYPGDDALGVDERVYQKSSYHEVVVDDVSAYTQQLREYFLSIEGRVLSSSVGTSKKYQQGYLVVKVPVAKFEEATARVTQSVEKIMTESINAEDETGQMVAATSAVEKLQEQKSLKEIELVEATTEVQRRRIQLEIDRLNVQIEKAQAAVEGVEAGVEYATISVSAASSERFFDPYGEPTVREEFERAWESASQVLRMMVYLVVWVLVYSVLWLPVVVLAKWVMGRMRKGQIKE